MLECLKHSAEKGILGIILGAILASTSAKIAATIYFEKILKNEATKDLRGTQFLEPFWRDNVPKGRILGAILNPKSVKINAKIDVEKYSKFKQIPAPANP